MSQGVLDAHQTRQALVEALRPGPRVQLRGYHPCRLLWPASAGGGAIGAVWQGGAVIVLCLAPAAWRPSMPQAFPPRSRSQ